MKILLNNFLIAGVLLMSHPNLALAQDTRLTQEYLSKIMSEAQKTYNVPAIAVTVMNSKSILLQEVQGVRVFDRQDKATLDDYFHIGSCAKSVLAVMAAKLIEQKKITWQTKFFEVFPELKGEADSAYRVSRWKTYFLLRLESRRIRTQKQNHFRIMAQRLSTRDWSSSNI